MNRDPKWMAAHRIGAATRGRRRHQLPGGCALLLHHYPTIVEANIDTLAAQIGGATTAVELYTVDNTDGTTTDWTLYSMANRFAATPVGMIKDAVTEITVPGFIQNITVVEGYGAKNYALLSMGGKGIGVVDITNPAAMAYVRTMTVNYLTPVRTRTAAARLYAATTPAPL
jgi:hypothetical protein